MLETMIPRRYPWRRWFFTVLLLAVPQVGAQDSVTYPPLSEVLRIGSPRLVIGEEQRDSPALFGIIRGVAVDGQGDIYVLDASDHSIRRFSSSGGHIVTAGGPGRGPGDLAQPFSLWHDGHHLLYVVDHVNGINVFDTRGREIVFQRRFAQGRGAGAVCSLRGQLVVAGFHDGHILHVMTDSGEVIRSFGDAFRPDTNDLVRLVGNSGPVVLTCDEPTGNLYVSQPAQGLVRAYRPDGKLLWETLLPGFIGSRVLRDRRGAVVTIFPRHITEAIRPVGSQHIVVQAHHKERRTVQNPIGGATRPRRVEIDRGILTFVLTASTGEVRAREYGGPFLMAGTRGEVVGYDDDPFPRVFAMRVTIVER